MPVDCSAIAKQIEQCQISACQAESLGHVDLARQFRYDACILQGQIGYINLEENYVEEEEILC